MTTPDADRVRESIRRARDLHEHMRFGKLGSYRDTCDMSFKEWAEKVGEILPDLLAAAEAGLEAQARIAELEALHTPIESYACERCGRRDGLDAVASKETWGLISEGGQARILCLWCMDDLAHSLGIEESISLHFAGKALVGASQSDADACHVRRLTERIADLEAERDRLKAALRGFSNFAWTAVKADCEESRGHLNGLIAHARAALERSDG